MGDEDDNEAGGPRTESPLLDNKDLPQPAATKSTKKGAKKPSVHPTTKASQKPAATV